MSCRPGRRGRRGRRRSARSIGEWDPAYRVPGCCNGAGRADRRGRRRCRWLPARCRRVVTLPTDRPGAMGRSTTSTGSHAPGDPSAAGRGSAAGPSCAMLREPSLLVDDELGRRTTPRQAHDHAPRRAGTTRCPSRGRGDAAGDRRGRDADRRAALPPVGRRCRARRSASQSPVWRLGAWTGFDSADPRWRRKIVSTTIVADGEELALPVLEGLEPELGGLHELPRADAGPTVLVLLGGVLVGTRRRRDRRTIRGTARRTRAADCSRRRRARRRRDAPATGRPGRRGGRGGLRRGGRRVPVSTRPNPSARGTR